MDSEWWEMEYWVSQSGGPLGDLGQMDCACTRPPRANLNICVTTASGREGMEVFK